MINLAEPEHHWEKLIYITPSSASSTHPIQSYPKQSDHTDHAVLNSEIWFPPSLPSPLNLKDYPWGCCKVA